MFSSLWGKNQFSKTKRIKRNMSLWPIERRACCLSQIVLNVRSKRVTHLSFNMKRLLSAPHLFPVISPICCDSWTSLRWKSLLQIGRSRKPCYGWRWGESLCQQFFDAEPVSLYCVFGWLNTLTGLSAGWRDGPLRRSWHFFFRSLGERSKGESILKWIWLILTLSVWPHRKIHFLLFWTLTFYIFSSTLHNLQTFQG